MAYHGDVNVWFAFFIPLAPISEVKLFQHFDFRRPANVTPEEGYTTLKCAEAECLSRLNVTTGSWNSRLLSAKLPSSLFFVQSWGRTFAKLLGWLCWSLSKHVCLTRCVSSKADASTNPLGEKLRYPPFINMDATWVKCICGVGQVWPWMFVMCECQRDDAASINIRCRCIMSQSCKDCIRHLNHPH